MFRKGRVGRKDSGAREELGVVCHALRDDAEIGRSRDALHVEELQRAACTRERERHRGEHVSLTLACRRTDAERPTSRAHLLWWAKHAKPFLLQSVGGTHEVSQLLLPFPCILHLWALLLCSPPLVATRSPTSLKHAPSLSPLHAPL